MTSIKIKNNKNKNIEMTCWFLHSKTIKVVLVVGLRESNIAPIIITISTIVKKKIVKNVVSLVLLVSYYCLYDLELQNKPYQLIISDS